MFNSIRKFFNIQTKEEKKEEDYYWDIFAKKMGDIKSKRDPFSEITSRLCFYLLLDGRNYSSPKLLCTEFNEVKLIATNIELLVKKILNEEYEFFIDKELEKRIDEKFKNIFNYQTIKDTNPIYPLEFPKINFGTPHPSAIQMCKSTDDSERII